MMGRVDDVEAGEGALREVSTPELDPPGPGVMRKKSRMYGLVELAVFTMMSIS